MSAAWWVAFSVTVAIWTAVAVAVALLARDIRRATRKARQR